MTVQSTFDFLRELSLIAQSYCGNSSQIVISLVLNFMKLWVPFNVFFPSISIDHKVLIAWISAVKLHDKPKACQDDWKRIGNCQNSGKKRTKRCRFSKAIFQSNLSKKTELSVFELKARNQDWLFFFVFPQYPRNGWPEVNIFSRLITAKN